MWMEMSESELTRFVDHAAVSLPPRMLVMLHNTLVVTVKLGHLYMESVEIKSVLKAQGYGIYDGILVGSILTPLFTQYIHERIERALRYHNCTHYEVALLK